LRSQFGTSSWGGSRYFLIREMILTHKDLLQKMDLLDNKVAKQNQKIALVFQYLKKFIDVLEKPMKRVR
jgi:hypothetical protein